MADKKKRFQSYLYENSESDIIDFFDGLRKNDKRIVFISAMRLYMTFSGHYLRKLPGNTGIKSDIRTAGNGRDSRGSNQNNKEEIEVMERLSGLADKF